MPSPSQTFTELLMRIKEYENVLFRKQLKKLSTPIGMLDE